MIDTYGVPYMGSKQKIIPSIHKALEGIEYDSVLDLFTGTTRVAQSFKAIGKKVICNDLSEASECYGALFIQHEDPASLQPYLDKMNSLEGYAGWFTENYHGDRTDAQKGDGRFMQYKNTIKVDAARDYVETLDVDKLTKKALIACIIFGFKQVDNVMGQQQAYLKEWCSRSFKDIKFALPGIIDGPKGLATSIDCFSDKWANIKDPGVVYVDPPYSKNVWYPSYYHINDSVAKWDKPETVGKANRRIDRSNIGKKQGIHDETFYDNPWYSNNPAVGFRSILENFPTSIVVISYSSDSALDKDATMEILSEYGEVTFYSVDHKTNVLGVCGSSSKGKKVITPKGKVKEYIYVVTRESTDL